MLEILGTAFGIVLIIALLVGVVISVAIAVTGLRQFNNIGDRHQEMADEFDKEWKGF